MTTANRKKCSHCHNAIYDPLDGKAASRKAHCLSPTCNWCEACFRAKLKECGKDA